MKAKTFINSISLLRPRSAIIKSSMKPDFHSLKDLDQSLEQKFEEIMKTKLTQRNAKYLAIEKKHQLEEYLFEIDPTLGVLIKTIPDVIFKLNQRYDIETYKSLFTYLCDPEKAMNVCFKCLLCDFIRHKDKISKFDTFYNSHLDSPKDKLTFGCIYRLIGDDINIYEDIKKISRVLVEK